MSDYYSDLDRIRAAGLEYATNGIMAGDTMPLDAPFSGEWADGLTGQDALDMAGFEGFARAFTDLEDFEQTDVLDAWQDGYLSAGWTEIEHVGHYARLTGAWYCDTCNSPYCNNA